MSAPETEVYGLNAALALGRHRPEAIVRVLHTRDVRRQIGPLLSATAKRRRPYREVTDDDLRRVAKTRHHEGVVVVAEPPPLRPLEPALRALRKDAVLVALDRVGNPHNLGSILRSAAWFGAAGVLLPRDDQQARLSGAAMRVAQGGAEVVPCFDVRSLPEALAALNEAGVHTIAADQRGRRAALAGPWPTPACIVLGSEGEGLRPEVDRACRKQVVVPGTGAVESLNVAVTAGILLAAATGLSGG